MRLVPKLALFGLFTLTACGGAPPLLTAIAPPAGTNRADQMALQGAETAAQAAPLKQAIAWQNPETGNSGTVTALRDGTASDGSYCREFEKVMIVGGDSQQTRNVTCRKPNGEWRIIK